MRALLTGLAVLAVLLLVLLALPYTEAGSRRLVDWVDRATPLDIEYDAGSLFGELRLVRVGLDADGVGLDFQSVVVDLDPGCLWYSEFCFELQFADAAVTWPGGSWSQGKTRASGVAREGQVSLASVWFEQGSLSLKSAEQSAEPGFTPPEVSLPLQLEVERLEAPELIITREGLAQSLRDIALSARWSGADLSISSLVLSAPELGELQATGTAQLQGQWPMALDLAVSLDGEAWPEPLWQRGATVEIAGTLEDVHLTLRSEGAPVASLDARLNLVEEGIPYRGEWALAWAPGTALAELSPSLGQTDLVLTGPLGGTVSGELLGTLATDFTAGLSGEGYAALELKGAVQWQQPTLSVTELSLSDAASESLLQLTADLQLAEQWRARGRLDSTGFALPASTLQGRLAGGLSIAAQGEGGNWSLAVSEVALDGELAGLPATIHGNGGIDSELALQPGMFRAQLNGTDLALEAGPDAADFSLALDSLGRWVAGSRGRVDVTARGTPELASLQLQGSIRSLLYEDFEVPAARLKGEYDVAAEYFQLQLDAPEVVRNEREFGLSLQAGGQLAAHTLDLVSTGEMAGSLSLRGAVTDGSWRGELAPTALATSAGAWELREPVALAWAGQEAQLKVSPHCWYHEHFELCGRQLQFGRHGDVEVELAGDVRALEVVLPRGMRLRGNVQGALAASWLPGAVPALDAQLQGEKLRVVRRFGMGESVRTEYEFIQLQARGRDDGQLDLSGTVRRDGREVIALTGTLPAEREGDMQLALKVGALQLTSFSPWFPEISSLEGRISGEVTVVGTVAEPLIGGEISLVDGRLMVVGNPTELTDLAMQLQLHNGGGDISGQGMLGGGELQFAGPLQLQPELSMQLAVKGGRHQVLMPPASELLVSEDLQLAFAERTMRVSGDVVVHEGVLRHEELPAGSVAISNDVVIVDVAGNAIETERPIDLDANVWVRIRDRFRVEGETLHAVLGGDLHLVQTPTTPLQVFGTLNLLGGQLRAYQQALTIQRGTIAFSGPPENPELDIGAEREIRSDDVTVGARLTGSLEDASLEVYSDPVMSQSEAMSYLVRGRGLDAGAGADGTALALAVGADVVNRSGIVTELNRMPLISDVSFGTSGSEDDTAATVSGYIGNRIYVSYGIGIYEPINVFTARLYLQSRLWLEVVSRLESSVDLYYSFDID